MRIPFFSKLFKREDPSQQPGTPRSTHHSPKDIAASLIRYANANTLVEGVISESKKPLRFTTGIMNVDGENRTLIFDAFTPQTCEAQLDPGTQVRFTLSHLGVRTQFDCQYQYTIESGRHEHVFHFPKGIEHIQLRDAFRIKINTINPLRMTLNHIDKGSYSGNISDLSVTGARIQLKNLIEPKPIRGDIYEQCYIMLSNGEQINTSAQLMHWQYDAKKSMTDLGVKFLDMNASTERKLNRFLTDLQRKERLSSE